MKRRFPSFLSGFLACALIVGGSASALAISGRMTIEVDPVNVQVNGAAFHPTDVNGKAVPVFAYNGTTYAPLRALAEAYGLEVGYDAQANLATVTDPDAAPAEGPAEKTGSDAPGGSAEEEAAYQAFKAMWTVAEKSHPDDHSTHYRLKTEDDTITDMAAFVRENLEFVRRLASELEWDDMSIGSIMFSGPKSSSNYAFGTDNL